MKRRLFLIIGLSILAACIVYVGLKTYQRIQYKKLAQSQMSKMHELPLFDLDSLSYKFNKHNPTILIFFNSACDHCQHQAYSIQDTLQAFQGIDIVWVSSEKISLIQEFSSKYRLVGKSGVYFTKIDERKVFETFGSLSIPHIFIYKNGFLTQEFKGATTSKELLNFCK